MARILDLVAWIFDFDDFAQFSEDSSISFLIDFPERLNINSPITCSEINNLFMGGYICNIFTYFPTKIKNSPLLCRFYWSKFRQKSKRLVNFFQWIEPRWRQSDNVWHHLLYNLNTSASLDTFFSHSANGIVRDANRKRVK